MLSAFNNRLPDSTRGKEIEDAILFSVAKEWARGAYALPGDVLENVEFHRDSKQESDDYCPHVQRKRAACVSGIARARIC
jgi:hypothetical protein